MFRGILGASSKVGITRRREQGVGCWKDMFLLDSYGGAADHFGALEMVLTRPALQSNEITTGGSLVYSPSRRLGEMPSADLSIAANNTPPI